MDQIKKWKQLSEVVFRLFEKQKNTLHTYVEWRYKAIQIYRWIIEHPFVRPWNSFPSTSNAALDVFVSLSEEE